MGAQGLIVALNAQLLSTQRSYRGAGIANYIYGLLRHLPAADPAITYYTYMAEAAATLPGMRQILTTHHTSRPVVRILWEQFVWPRLLRHTDPDIIHGMAYVLPLTARRPGIVTIYDLTFLHIPDAFRAPNRLYLRLMTRWSARRAAHICAISEQTRHDIVTYLGVPPERVSIVYPGVDARFRPPSSESVAAFRQQRGLPERYLLYLGTLEPRKNLVTLVRAYAEVVRHVPMAPLLVLAGAKGWYFEEIFAEVERLGIADRVHFPGYVPVEEQPLWYGGADIFIYPSRYEGFGMPVAEAMACGTPVITSNRSSLPEVVGEAGWLVPPNDVEALTEAMITLLHDDEERARLRAEGIAQARRFSWEAAAREQVRVYREVAEKVEGGL